MTLVKKSEKEQLKQRLLNELPELEKAGWKKIHIDLLKKHFTFYYSLIHSEIPPKEEKYKKFVETIKNWKTAKPKNIHEEIYLNYTKFFMKKNSNKKDDKILDPVWKNIPQNISAYQKIEDQCHQSWDENLMSWCYLADLDYQ